MNSELKIDPQLLNLLCCPACKGDSSLEPDKELNHLECNNCYRKYLLKEVAGPDGKGIHIPQLLITDEDS